MLDIMPHRDATARKVPGGVNHTGDLDPVGGRLVQDDEVACRETARTARQVRPQLSQQWIAAQYREFVEESLQYTNGGRWIAISNVVRKLFQVKIGLA